jgi:hypothetical protein
VAAAHTLYVSLKLPETVDHLGCSSGGGSGGGLGDDRKPVSLAEVKFVSPLSALSIFQRGKALRWFAAVAAIQCALEPKAWSNVMTL